MTDEQTQEPEYDYWMTYGGTRYRVTKEIVRSFDRWDGKVKQVIIDKGDGHIQLFVTPGVPLEFVVKPSSGSSPGITVV